MRRLGTILMILGVNLIVASMTAAFWRASYECALRASGGACTEGVVRLFIQTLFSGGGLVYWFVIVAGLWVFFWGKRMRAK